MRERLAELAAAGDPGRSSTEDAGPAYDLDAPPDIYGDGIVRQLEERVARLLGKPDAAFFPTGTMAQQVALRCWAARTNNSLVALHPLAHPVLHERGALTTLTGLRTLHPTTAPRLPTAAEVEAVDEPFGTLMLELPLREAGFVLPSWDELTAVVRAARDRDAGSAWTSGRGAIVHFDGARLWECPPHFGKPLDEIADLADSVYVSFYKSLGGLSGAALAGPPDFIADAKAWRHRYGGHIYHQFPTILAALRGLDTELPRLARYVDHAKIVAAALADTLGTAFGWFRLHPDPPQTHQFALWLPFAADTLGDACLRMEEETRTSLFGRWADTELPGVAKTEVTVAAPALDWTAGDVAEAARTFISYLS